MPELPEVETIRRQLAPVTEGRTITAVSVPDARWCQPLARRELSARLRGRRIDSFERRGKFMVLRLDDGSLLVMHLRMTGNLLYVPAGECVPRDHLRARIELDDGASLAFVDPRRFGTAAIHPGQDSLDRYFDGRVGVEPLEPQFTPELLFKASRGRRTPIKAFLLDQSQVAGIGNIYADEALHRAAISPRMRTARLKRAQAVELRDSIRAALRDGIDAKGASIDDFRDAYGVRGSFQDHFLVHRREGLPCPGCGEPVKKIRVAGRGTYYCPSCQRS